MAQVIRTMVSCTLVDFMVMERIHGRTVVVHTSERGTTEESMEEEEEFFQMGTRTRVILRRVKVMEREQ